jgi:hypothetical protein
MSKAQKAALKAGEETYQWVGWVECIACGQRQKVTAEVGVEHDEPIVPLECEGCGGMTCNPD